jgi:hypothetical protein
VRDKSILGEQGEFITVEFLLDDDDMLCMENNSLSLTCLEVPQTEHLFTCR